MDLNSWAIDPDLNFSVDIDCQTYSCDSFNTRYRNSGGLFILHQNIRSFNKNIDEFLLCIGNLSRFPDVLVLSETWFNSENCQELPNYHGYHSYRTNKMGGGISIFIHEKFESKINANLNIVTEDSEFCSAELIISRNIKINIIGFYRPPIGNATAFCDYIESIIQNDFFANKKIIFCGDGNIDISCNSAISNYYTDMFKSSSFFQCISLPTRVSNNSSSNIDHIWSNLVNNSHAGVLLNGLTDHYSVFLTIELQIFNTIYTVKKFRDHSQRCIENFVDSVERSLSSFDVYDDLGIEIRVAIFSDILWNSYDKYCPIREKTVKIEKSSKPWFDDDLRKLCKMKHDPFAKYRRGEIGFNVYKCNVYNRFKNELVSLLKLCKITYYSSKFLDSKGNTKSTWSSINDVIGNKRKYYYLITILVILI